MSAPWLHIMGIGAGGIGDLGPKERAFVRSAKSILGPKRLLDDYRAGPGQLTANWQGGGKPLVEQVLALRGQSGPVLVLGTGDPSWFGIGASLAGHLAPDEYQVYPSPSSFQLAAARMRWPLQNVATLSLHGRQPALLHPHILPGNRVLALTSNAAALGAVAKLLTARGYGASVLGILEELGGPGERVRTFTASEANTQTVGDFYVLAIDCIAGENAALLPPVPGLPDDTFVSDGQLTKREVRAATLAKLAPVPGALLWDVGAGAGSVAIEWMRAARNARAICFERDENRREMIARNRMALGVPGLQVIAGQAPASLTGQDRPDAIFLGGDVASQKLFAACWQALEPGGRLVANAVTLDAEAALCARQKRFGGELVRIGIAVLDKIGGENVLRPRLGVTQWALEKDKTP